MKAQNKFNFLAEETAISRLACDKNSFLLDVDLKEIKTCWIYVIIYC